MGDVSEPVYDVVWPKSPRGVQGLRAAERLTTLDGARIGFVWDYLFRGEEIFPVLAAELQRRYPGLEVVGYDTFGNIHGPDEHALVAGLADTARAHRVDAVVVGNGC
jgi:hypothetical protein